MSRKIFPILVGAVIAFGISVLFIFAFGPHSNVTVFGADDTLVFFQSFFISIISVLIAEVVQESNIKVVIGDIVLSAIVSVILVFGSKLFPIKWLNIMHLWAATWVYTGSAVVTLIAAAIMDVNRKK